MTTPAPEPRASGTGPFGAGTDVGATFAAATQVKPLVMAVGMQVVPLVDPSRGGPLLGQFAPARQRIALALGFVMPSVTLRDDPELRDDAYAIRVRGVTVAQGTAQPGRWLAVVGQGSDWAAASPGEPTSDPATGRAAYWIGEADVARARSLGHAVLDPTGAMVAHLEAVVRANAWLLIDREHVMSQLDALRQRDARLAAAIAARMDLGLLTRVLRRLLAEGVSIRDFAAVLDALDETPAGTRSSLALAEHVRRRLAAAICRDVAPEGVLHVVDLRAWERLALRRVDAALRPGPAYPLGFVASRALAALRDRVLAAGTPGQVAVVRAPARLRPHLGVMLAAGPGPVSVLAIDEVPPGFTVLAAAPPQLPAGVRARNIVRRWRVRGQLLRTRLAEGLGSLLSLGTLLRELPRAMAHDAVELPQRFAAERQEQAWQATRAAELAHEAANVRDAYAPEVRVVVLQPAELRAQGVVSAPLLWLERQDPGLLQAVLAPMDVEHVTTLLDTLDDPLRAACLALFPAWQREGVAGVVEMRRGDFHSEQVTEAIAALLERLGLGLGTPVAASSAVATDGPPAWPATGVADDALAPAIAGRDRPPEPDLPPPDLAYLEAFEAELVAELLAGEEPALAAGVIGALSPGYADLVLSLMPFELQEALINRLQAGASLTPAMLTRLDQVQIGSSPGFAQYGPTDAPVNDGPFGFLEQLDPEMVADLLCQERPGTAAGVIGQLTPLFADMVLSVMPPDVQEDLINRLQTMPMLPGFQLAQIIRNLRRRLGVPV